MQQEEYIWEDGYQRKLPPHWSAQNRHKSCEGNLGVPLSAMVPDFVVGLYRQPVCLNELWQFLWDNDFPVSIVGSWFWHLIQMLPCPRPCLQVFLHPSPWFRRDLAASSSSCTCIDNRLDFHTRATGLHSSALFLLWLCIFVIQKGTHSTSFRQLQCRIISSLAMV